MSKSEKKLNSILHILLAVFIFFNYTIMQIFGDIPKVKGIILLLPIILMFIFTSVYQRGRIRFKIDSFIVFMLIFIAYVYISSMWANESSYPKLRAQRLLEMLFAVIVMKICMSARINTESFLKVIMFSGYFVVVYQFTKYGFNYFIEPIILNNRLPVEFNYSLNSNVLGITASYSMLIHCYLLANKKIKNVSIIFIPLAFIVLLATGSRKAFLIIAISVTGFILLKVSDKRKIENAILALIISVLIISLIVAVCSQFSMFQGVTKRFIGLINILTGQGAVEASASIRKTLIELGIKIFRENPIIGVGIDNPKLYSYKIFNYEYYLHNNFVELLAGGGIIGFLSFYWLHFLLAFEYWKYRDFRNQEYNIGLVFLGIQPLIDFTMVTYSEKVTYIILLMLYINIRNIKQRGNRII